MRHKFELITKDEMKVLKNVYNHISPTLYLVYLSLTLQAKKAGMLGVIVDLRLTQDGIIVLLHDEDVVRTTDGAGHISKMNYDEVQKLNAAAKFKSQKG